MASDKVNAIAVDVDGTLTDGKYYLDENGKLMKSFHTRDIWAIRHAQRHGFYVFMLTSADDQCAPMKASQRDIPIIMDVKNKVEAIEDIMSQMDISWDNVAFIGDGENDYSVMQKCKFTACPNDAVEEIKNIAEYVSNRAGGEGVAHDVIKKIFMSQNISWI